METRVTRITQRSAYELEVQYHLKTKSGKIDRHAVRSCDAANPKLYRVLQRMREHVITVLELPADYAEGLKVIAVSLIWPMNSESLTPDVVIRAEKSIAGLGEPFCITTPRDVCCTSAARDLKELCQLAMQFAQGERSQLDLFNPPPIVGDGARRIARHADPNVANVSHRYAGEVSKHDSR